MRYTGLALLGVCCLFGIAVGSPLPAQAQDPLALVNSDTEVRSISFRFVETESFSPDRLQQRMATRAPTGWDRLQRRLPLMEPTPRLFDPILFQRDIARLRNFYRDNGFPEPRIDYPATQFNAESNTIRLVITIREGEPLIIQDALFLNDDGSRYAISAFEEEMRDQWADFRDDTDFEIGSRYTEFNRQSIEDDVARWLRNQGYAFSRVHSEVQTDLEARTADIRFFVDPGPQARVGNIEISGNESVERRIIERSLPLREGDLFSADKLSEGQRKLFNLNLFRVALADVPEQPRDTVVNVRYRVRESNLRTLSGEAGYGTNVGVTAEGRWSHRNFFGNARSFSARAVAETGFPDDANFLPAFLAGTGGTILNERRFRGSVLIRQPYVFTPDLSVALEPFGEIRRNPRLPGVQSGRLGINEGTYGFSTTLTYEFLPFRSISLRHSLQRRRQFIPDELQTGIIVDPDAPVEDVGTGAFNRSVFTLSGTFGRTDDYISPTRGFLVRPTIEMAGALIPSGMQYTKLSLEVSGYQPIGSSIDLAARAFAGRVMPFGDSREALQAEPSLRNTVFRNRFDNVLFYTGGGTDLRGWPINQAGSKFINTTDVEDIPSLLAPTGGTTKLLINSELRLPFPGLGSDWRTAVFLDAGWLGTDAFSLVPARSGEDSERFATSSDQVRIGTGAGIRYQTPFGFVRLDIAIPLNPDPLDVRAPDDIRQALREGRSPTDAPTSFTRQFRLHMGIGRTF